MDDETVLFISFDIDPNGILSVKAEEKSHNNEDQKIKLNIENDDMTFTEYELDKLKKKIEKCLIKKVIIFL